MTSSLSDTRQNVVSRSYTGINEDPYLIRRFRPVYYEKPTEAHGCCVAEVVSEMMSVAAAVAFSRVGQRPSSVAAL